MFDDASCKYMFTFIPHPMGIAPNPARLEINAVLPDEWGWEAASRTPYPRNPLSLVAVYQAKASLYHGARQHRLENGNGAGGPSGPLPVRA